MTAAENGNWYMVTHDGAATLCVDEADAQEEAKKADMAWPRSGPHRAVQLVEVGSVSLSANAGEPTQGAFQRELSIRTAQGWTLRGDKVPVLYTDEINGEQVCRDDVWLCTTAALAAPPTAQAGGWRLVPVEPTQAMLDAVVTTMDDALLGKEAEKQYREDWAAMLAAAPTSAEGVDHG